MWAVFGGSSSYMQCVRIVSAYLVAALVGCEAGERAQGRVQQSLLIVAEDAVQLFVTLIQ